jgi:hypothetical protein
MRSHKSANRGSDCNDARRSEVGTGAQLFAEGTRSATWKLVKSRVGDAGVIIATYVPAGELVTGTIGG